MKKYILFISVSLFLVCCNNSSNEPEGKEDTAATIYSWEASLNDSTGNIEVKKSAEPGPDSLTIAAVTDFLNKEYPNVQLQFKRTSGDTLYMSIPQATYLTQQMGSTGPQLYFADAVYNLTEIPGIHFVNFDFAEGDHAGPGVLNRDGFKDK